MHVYSTLIAGIIASSTSAKLCRKNKKKKQCKKDDLCKWTKGDPKGTKGTCGFIGEKKLRRTHLTTYIDTESPTEAQTEPPAKEKCGCAYDYDAKDFVCKEGTDYFCLNVYSWNGYMCSCYDDDKTGYDSCYDTCGEIAAADAEIEYNGECEQSCRDTADIGCWDDETEYDAGEMRMWDGGSCIRSKPLYCYDCDWSPDEKCYEGSYCEMNGCCD